MLRQSSILPLILLGLLGVSSHAADFGVAPEGPPPNEGTCPVKSLRLHRWPAIRYSKRRFRSLSERPCRTACDFARMRRRMGSTSSAVEAGPG